MVAEWADRERRSLGVPALIRTPSGIYISHIWNGGVSGAPLELMQSIVGALAPELKRNVAELECRMEQRLADQRREARRIGLKEGEVRAVWCHMPYGYDADHGWDASVKLMKECGYTDLVANLCWGGLAFYRSDVLPVSPEVEVRGDALDQCLAACRRHGLKLHVWKVCWRMHSKVDASYKAAMKAAGRTQVKFDGSDELGWFCPSNPENRKAEVETMLELARRGVDGVHFDYIRYNSAYGCVCEGCRRRFEKRFGIEVKDWPAEIRRNADIKGKWNDFRRDNISTVVREVAERLHGRSGVQVSAAVFHNIDACRESVAQDWTMWCRSGWLDFVCPMDYTPSAKLFRSMVGAQKAAIGGTRMYPGIGLSCWKDDGDDVRRLGEQMEVVRELGLPGFTVFSLCRRSAEVLPAFSPDPDTVWLETDDAEAAVSLRGGRVLSFRTPCGEVLWHPRRWRLGGPRWAHGGMPICWPWFGSRGPVPGMLHGFAWMQRFEVRRRESRPGRSEVVLGLASSAETRRIWPYDFDLELKVSLTDRLSVELRTENRGDRPFTLTTGFHPYFSIGERDRTVVTGTDGMRFCDSRVTNVFENVWKGDMRLTSSFDHVFVEPRGTASHSIVDPVLGRRICETSSGAARLVVWNPGEEEETSPTSAPGALSDGDWRRLICVEPAILWSDAAVQVAPGGIHTISAEISADSSR